MGSLFMTYGPVTVFLLAMLVAVVVCVAVERRGVVKAAGGRVAMVSARGAGSRPAFAGAGGVLVYDWRYRDVEGRDITADVVRDGGDGVVVAEAVQDRTGTVLLAVHRTSGGWRIAGGHLGRQVSAGAYVLGYGSPYAAMQMVASALRMTAAER